MLSKRPRRHYLRLFVGGALLASLVAAVPSIVSAGAGGKGAFASVDFKKKPEPKPTVIPPPPRGRHHTQPECKDTIPNGDDRDHDRARDHNRDGDHDRDDRNGKKHICRGTFEGRPGTDVYVGPNGVILLMRGVGTYYITPDRGYVLAHFNTVRGRYERVCNEEITGIGYPNRDVYALIDPGFASGRCGRR